ncbi:hypothetical protein CHARACLAT_029619 [Characodon lateralis]|uniref:Secreted protein n=1 Tax=Characodon lateralis TaxID=208331 RepID=A0ABU7EDW7_9TELE|nr:hypothetical protein [Characodon lateralis]
MVPAGLSVPGLVPPGGWSPCRCSSLALLVVSGRSLAMVFAVVLSVEVGYGWGQLLSCPPAEESRRFPSFPSLLFNRRHTTKQWGFRVGNECEFFRHSKFSLQCLCFVWAPPAPLF